MTLKDTQPGEKVKIVKLNGEGATKRRIMDMGITKGIEVFVRKVAPLGDPIEVTVRGYELSVRKADAQLGQTHFNDFKNKYLTKYSI
ncbi:MAG: ferrous iron transport protein A [Treponema sp.]|nr:ferrous iron transport protein A [Treponema sp.]